MNFSKPIDFLIIDYKYDSPEAYQRSLNVTPLDRKVMQELKNIVAKHGIKFAPLRSSYERT